MRYLPLLLVAASTTAIAAQRDLNQARQVAQQQLSSLVGHEVKLAEQPQRAALRSEVAADASFLPYYHFTDADNKAFVIVSGSDLLPEVIGYGMADSLMTEGELPINMQSWLDQVAEAEQYLEENPIAALAETEARSQAAATKVIAPLMSCKWGQGSPYNKNCPVKDNERSVAGCVATAISQVLYTNQYPKQSSGYVSWKDYGTVRNVDLNTTYNYNKMTDTYSKNSTSAEQDEVAKLVYNVGAACNMQYGVDASASNLEYAERGMHDYFSCTKVQIVRRHYYSLDEWNAILQEQLEAGLPIPYAAQSETGGHAFVVDGLDNKGFYHVNWGWSGNWNGYFDISILRTDGAGTGASVNNGFTSDQRILVNLCDPSKATRWYNVLNTLYAEDYTTYDKIKCSQSGSVSAGSKITMSAKVMNITTQDYDCQPGVILMKDGKEQEHKLGNSQLILSGTENSISNKGEFLYTYYYAEVSVDYTLPKGLSDGNYQLWLYMSPTGKSDRDMIRQTHASPSYWTLNVSNGKYTLSHDEYGIPAEISNWSTDPVQITTAGGVITCNAKNTADETMPICFTLKLTSPSGTTSQEIACGNEYFEATTLAPGETQQLSFNVQTNASGKWKATLYGVQQGVTSSKKTALAQTTFEVATDDTRAAELSMVSDLKLLTSDIHNDEDITFEMSVSNSGEAYNGKMSIRLFKSSTSVAENSLVAEIGPDDVKISAHKSSTTIQITGHLKIDGLSKATKYYARAFYLYGDDMEQLKANYGYTNKVAVPVSPAQDTEITEVTVDEPQSASLSPTDQIYNLLGKRVQLPADGRLRPGIYIVNGKKRVIN